MIGGVLIIVTGPSHSGKSSAIRRVMRLVEWPSAWVAIDEIIGRLSVGRDSVWPAALPGAYDVAAAESGALLRRGFTVFVESTFTFVPPGGTVIERHPEQLERLLDVARRCDSPAAVIRFHSSEEELLGRRERTGRLDPDVVSGTARAHAGFDLADALDVDTSALARDQVAEQLAAFVRTLRGEGLT